MTHGILTTMNGQTEIKGTFNFREPGSISFTPDGARTAAFFSSSEWDFEAEKPTLPTKDGYYVGSHLVEHDGTVSPVGAVFRLYSGGWSCINSSTHDAESWAQNILESQGLTRITFIADN